MSSVHLYRARTKTSAFVVQRCYLAAVGRSAPQTGTYGHHTLRQYRTSRRMLRHVINRSELTTQLLDLGAGADKVVAPGSSIAISVPDSA
eukprot:806840-Rhodomonas_salina.1